jgi:hypothetical protein
MKNFALILFLLGCVACSKRAPETRPQEPGLEASTCTLIAYSNGSVYRCDDEARHTTCYLFDAKYTGDRGISCMPTQIYEEN